MEKSNSQPIQSSSSSRDIGTQEAPPLLLFSPDSFASSRPDPGFSVGLYDFNSLSLIGIVNSE